MKSLSYLFTAALLLSASPLIAMDPLASDEDLKNAPTLTSMTFKCYIKSHINPFDMEAINGELQYMSRPHNLHGKLTLKTDTLDKIRETIGDIDISNYRFEPTYYDTSDPGIPGVRRIRYTLTALPGFKPEDDKKDDKKAKKKLILDTLPKVIFEAKSQPLIEEESIMVIDAPANSTSLKLSEGKKYDQWVLRSFPKLTVLDVSRAKNCPQIPYPENIEELYLAVHADDFNFPHLPNLKYLDISHASKLVDVESILHNCPKLEAVNFSHSKIEYHKVGGTQLKDVMMQFIKRGIEVVYEN